MAKMAEQMRHLNKKGTHLKGKEQWTPEEEFKKLKEEICNAFVKELFNMNRKFLVYTDAFK